MLITGIEAGGTKENPVALYPNPAEKEVYINFGDNKIFSEYSIELLNTLGKKVLLKILNSSDVQKLNVNNLEAGLYIYYIKNNDCILQKGKLLIK